MKTRLASILICVLGLLAVVGVVLAFTVYKSQNEFSESIDVGSDGTGSKQLKVSLAGFYPGMSRDYTLKLSGKKAGDCVIELVFDKTAGSGLEQYITTAVSINDEQVDSRLLKEFFEGQTVRFNYRLSAKAVKVNIRYAMPTETGNEAQGTAVDFNVKVSVHKAGTETQTE